MTHLSSLFVAVAVLGGGSAIADTGTSTKPTSTLDDDPAAKLQSADLFFEFDSANVGDDAASNEKLGRVARWAKCHPRGKVVLEGHTDPIGTNKYNIGLSARRADAVRATLIELGARPDQIVIGMYGEVGPLRDSDAENRRVTAKTTMAPLDAIVKKEGANGATAMVVLQPVSQDEG